MGFVTKQAQYQLKFLDWKARLTARQFLNSWVSFFLYILGLHKEVINVGREMPKLWIKSVLKDFIDIFFEELFLQRCENVE